MKIPSTYALSKSTSTLMTTPLVGKNRLTARADQQVLHMWSPLLQNNTKQHMWSPTPFSPIRSHTVHRFHSRAMRPRCGGVYVRSTTERQQTARRRRWQTNRHLGQDLVDSVAPPHVSRSSQRRVEPATLSEHRFAASHAGCQD